VPEWLSRYLRADNYLETPKNSRDRKRSKQEHLLVLYTQDTAQSSLQRLLIPQATNDEIIPAQQAEELERVSLHAP
jgi:hypothetical protein